MSRKHYIEVAKVIAYHHSSKSPDSVKAVVQGIAEDLATMFKADNSAFDRSRFMDACGLTSEGN